MTTTASSRSSVDLVRATRQQLDELDALLERMLELPVNQVEEGAATSRPSPARLAAPSPEKEPRPAAPAGIPAHPPQPVPEQGPPEQASLPGPASTVPPAAPAPMEQNEEGSWVPLRSTWQPSAQTWGPLAQTWRAAQTRTGEDPAPSQGPAFTLVSGPPSAPAPEQDRRREEPPLSVRSPFQDRGDLFPVEVPASRTPAPAPALAPAPAAADAPEETPASALAGLLPRLISSDPTETLAAGTATPERVPLWALPLVKVNRGFDRLVAPLGPLGRLLKGPTGRRLLGWVGGLCLIASGLLTLLDCLGWTW